MVSSFPFVILFLFPLAFRGGSAFVGSKTLLHYDERTCHLHSNSRIKMRNRGKKESKDDIIPQLKAVAIPFFESYTAKPALLAGDFSALLTFAVIGRASHDESVDLIGSLLTAFPFILGFFAVAKPLGAYDEGSTDTYQRMLDSLGPAWFFGILSGCILRGIGKLAFPPIAFCIATLIFTFVLLVLPRTLLVYTHTGELPFTEARVSTLSKGNHSHHL